MRTGISTRSPATTSTESSNKQKDNIGIMWNHITQALTPAGCGRGDSPITDCKGKPSHNLPKIASLPDELNSLYVCFDNNNTIPYVRAPIDPEDWAISLSEADMS